MYSAPKLHVTTHHPSLSSNHCIWLPEALKDMPCLRLTHNSHERRVKARYVVHMAAGIAIDSQF